MDFQRRHLSQWNPDVNRRTRVDTEELRRRDTSDAEGDIVNRDGLPQGASIARKMIEPEFVTDDRNGRRSRICILRGNRAAKHGRHAKT